MKNQILIIVLFAVLVGGASYTYIARQELKNREFEIQARKEEAALKQAEAKRKTAEAESRKAKEQAAEAKSKADAAKDERQSRLAAEAEAKELAKAKADEARKAEAEAEIAAENARKAEAARKTAETDILNLKAVRFINGIPLLFECEVKTLQTCEKIGIFVFRKHAESFLITLFIERAGALSESKLDLEHVAKLGERVEKIGKFAVFLSNVAETLGITGVNVGIIDLRIGAHHTQERVIVKICFRVVAGTVLEIR
jgi:nucleoid-associated protein YgaU